MKSLDVRIWGIRLDKRAKNPMYELRWRVAGEVFHERFRTKGLVDTFRAKLVTATKDGEPFDTESGLPASMEKKTSPLTWYEFACAYAAAKWPFASANHRDSISETLTGATLAMLADRPGRPDAAVLRAALRGWAFIPAERWPDQPTEVANALHWVGRSSRPVADLAEPAAMRALLDALALRQDGRRAAAETVRRKRSVLYGALTRAVELRALTEHPIDAIKVAGAKVNKQVDRRVVVNPKQARELLIAVSYVGGYSRARGRRLVAMFACMYYAGLRPAEAVGLLRTDCTLPKKGWGVIVLHKTRPTAGKRWTDSGDTHDARGLKNRAEEETRRIPIPPVLVKHLRRHLRDFPGAKDGRVFGNERGDLVGSSTYSRAWQEARELALTPEQAASPLAGTPYDLRHAALSTWLNAGMDPPEVAQRAGNSVDVLMSRYAKCLDGRDEINNQKIEKLLRGKH
ncbi:tyrosine-type recombinase/integrase [Yinghuangia soli]|uniref:Tyrosine-type recombinase/integrase n=1 Tax=Yinghuangia soli TaxID=2908204 RepID=A0AA41U330_9ACTN|nr:tyrosine-type recombinase/integrase [Yinghuangia soli]MCF2531331.1 tyrosine-type recombinase/integrase [Yinghuangia soli]